MPSQTNKAPKMNAADVAVVVQHLDDLIDSACSSKEMFAQLKRRNRMPFVIGQWKYWQNVESGLKWAKRLAIQTEAREHGRKS